VIVGRSPLAGSMLLEMAVIALMMTAIRTPGVFPTPSGHSYWVGCLDSNAPLLALLN
jgi:hypothetical protein